MMMWLAIICAALLPQDTPQKEESTLQKMEREFTTVIAKVKPSVVAIRARFTIKTQAGLSMSGDLKFSGVVYRKDGYIVTDASGVTGSDEITVTLPDERAFKSKLIAADGRTGIAVLKIDATDLPEVEFAAGKEIKTGVFAIAVGNADGLKGSASIGYVSGLERTIVVGGSRYEDMIQMSTPVNPGDCGGLVVNSQGRLLGIVNSTYQADADSPGNGILELFGKTPAIPANMSFAAHADTVRFVADRIIKHKRMVRGWLGVSMKMVDATTRQQIGIDEGVGASILRVEPRSPAAKCGLRRNDIVVSYDGEAVKDLAALKKKVESLEEAKTVKIIYYRRGQKQEVEIKVELEPNHR